MIQVTLSLPRHHPVHFEDVEILLNPSARLLSRFSVVYLSLGLFAYGLGFSPSFFAVSQMSQVTASMSNTC